MEECLSKTFSIRNYYYKRTFHGYKADTIVGNIVFYGKYSDYYYAFVSNSHTNGTRRFINKGSK